MSAAITNKSLLAKNTLSLFARMLLVMGVSLYTSRVVLGILGVVDYGVYNVVSGVITMFAFINSSMTSATQRYITFAIGNRDPHNMNRVFSSSVQVHFIIALIILLLGETVGLWYVSHKVVIPESSFTGAMWVYQFSIVTAIVGIMAVPYTATIIAHEKMSAFAFISVLEASLKLAVILLLWLIPQNKLIVYGALLLCVQIIIRSIYSIYCRRHFHEAVYRHSVDMKMIKEIGSFAGWSFFGNLSSVLNGEGINQLLNLFFGPVVNAARGLAIQIQIAVQQLASNFQIAINPQITKNYASGNIEAMHNLMFFSTRITFTLVLMVVLPLLIETHYVLYIWLKHIPEQTVTFTRLMLCIVVLNPFSSPLSIANQATGNIRTFQVVVGTLLLLILPISYVVLKMGGNAPSVYMVYLAVECVAVVIRFFLLRRQIGLTNRKYLSGVIVRVIPVLLLSPILPFIVRYHMDDSFLRLVLVTAVSIISVAGFSYTLGMSKTEREMIRAKFSSLIAKANRR